MALSLKQKIGAKIVSNLPKETQQVIYKKYPDVSSTISPIPKSTETVLTPEEYRYEIQQKQSDVAEKQKTLSGYFSSIGTGIYRVKFGGRSLLVSGSMLKKIYTKNEQRLSIINSNLSQQYSESYEWDPGTTIIKKEILKDHVSYTPVFPYAGAEKYQTYKRMLQQDPGRAAALGWSAGGYGNIDIAVYRLTGNEEAILRKQIGQLENIKQLQTEGVVGAVKYWWGSPATQIGMTYTGASIIGKGLGYTTGFFTQVGKVGTAKLINYAAISVGSALAVPSAIKIVGNVSSGDIGGAIGESWLFGISATAGYVGYKSGYAPGYKTGAIRGFKKYLTTELTKGNIDTTLYTESMKGLTSGSYLEKNMMNIKLNQPNPRFTDIRSLQNQPILRTYISNKLLRIKHEIFGGAGSNKIGGTHDLDVMLTGRGAANSKYASRFLTGKSISEFADVKPFQKPGDIAGEFTIKQTPVKTSGGYTIGKWQEQFSRQWGSSLRPAYKGRLKDMPGSIETLDKMYAGKIMTPETTEMIAQYKESMRYLHGLGEKNPLISSISRYKSIYSLSLKQKIFETSIKFWEKITPESFKKIDVLKNINKPSNVKWVEHSSRGFIPPTPSKIFSPHVSSSLLGSLSSFYFSSNVFKYISPSISFYSPSYSPSYSPPYSPPHSPSYSPPYSPSYSPPYSPSYSPPYSPSYSPPYSPSYSPPYSPSYSPSYSPPHYLIYFPKLSGGGNRGNILDKLSQKYMYREFKIPNLDKLFKGVKI